MVKRLKVMVSKLATSVTKFEGGELSTLPRFDDSANLTSDKDAEAVPTKDITPQFHQDFKQALELFRRGAAKEALQLGLNLPEAIRIDPFVAIEIAKFARAARDWKVMLSYGELATRSAPNSAPIVNTYSEMLMLVGRNFDAFSELVEALVRTKDAIIFDHLRTAATAIASAELSDTQSLLASEAIEGLMDALPQFPDAMFIRVVAVVIELRGLVNGIERNFPLIKRTLEAQAAGQNIEFFLNDLSENREITASLSDLLQALPESLPIFFSHALALEYAGRQAEALAILNTLIETPLASEEMYLKAASVQGRTEKSTALATLQAANRQFPNSIAINKGLCELAAGMGEFAIAEAAATRLIKEAPNNPEAQLIWIRILLERELFDDALQVAEDALTENNNSTALLEAAAQAARGAGRNDIALNYVRAAVDVDSTNGDLVKLYAELSISEAQFDQQSVLIKDFFERDLAFLEQAVRGLLKLIWPRVPDYVDNRHVEMLQLLVLQNNARFPLDLMWEIVRIADLLKLYNLARNFLSLSIERTSLIHAPLLSNFVAFLNHISRAELENLSDPSERANYARHLLTAGLSAVATNQTWRAEVSFRLAAYLAPENPSAQINAGYANLTNGCVDEALKNFAVLSRIYSKDMESVVWPESQFRRPWPLAPFACANAFEALKPDDVEWPLITVITPSFNQGKYIEDTILSVLNQEYPRVQYIIVDGLSSDETIDIIKRYELRVDTVIIEKDNGQTEAINKGLSRARGELVTWINSDDMLAPGALHIAALTWLRSRADLLYGACLPHQNYQFLLANLPEVDKETFTLQHLGEIFKYWMKGFFFYQPEVFFSKRILDVVGGRLDESLYFTMDYKFWLQCAQNHAVVEKVYWPFAFFRQHSEQKTANLLDCIIEQARIRDEFVRIEPSASRKLDVRSNLRRAFAHKSRQVGIVSSRLGKIFSEDLPEHLSRISDDSATKLVLVDSANKLENPDLVIKLVHLQGDVDEIEQLRMSGYRGAIIGWFWDNHHHLFQNFEVSERLDVVIPSHSFASAYLRNKQAHQAESVPLCVTQWSDREARELYANLQGRRRSENLYGSFVRYAFAKKRNNLIEALIDADCNAVSFLDEGNLARYFSRSASDRFDDWMSHKVSVCLPLAGDLSQRLFDALLTGQIPLVPFDIWDLDNVISPKAQAMLPIIKFDSYDPAEVLKAHKFALEAFDRDGQDGAQRRHLFALSEHTFSNRIQRILRVAEQLSIQL